LQKGYTTLLHGLAGLLPRSRGATGLGKDYADSIQPTSSSKPKAATAGPNTACQRDDGVCAGCSSPRCLAIVSSRSRPQERLALQSPACRVAIKWYCGCEGILPRQQVAPLLDCSAERLMPRPREGHRLRVVTGWLAQRVVHQTLVGHLEEHLQVACRRAGHDVGLSCFLQDHYEASGGFTEGLAFSPDHLPPNS
jgi:hypothetical protein